MLGLKWNRYNEKRLPKSSLVVNINRLDYKLLKNWY